VTCAYGKLLSDGYFSKSKAIEKGNSIMKRIISMIITP